MRAVTSWKSSNLSLLKRKKKENLGRIRIKYHKRTFDRINKMDRIRSQPFPVHPVKESGAAGVQSGCEKDTRLA